MSGGRVGGTLVVGATVGTAVVGTAVVGTLVGLGVDFFVSVGEKNPVVGVGGVSTIGRLSISCNSSKTLTEIHPMRLSDS